MTSSRDGNEAERSDSQIETDCKDILLSSMGVWPEGKQRKPLSYTLGEEKRTSLFSAFGLWQLLDEADRPTEIWFLLTAQARDTQWEEIQKEADRLGVAVKAIDLSDDMDDTRGFLEQTASAIPEGCRLTLNVTEGLRHHAFLFYALALYLTSFRQIEIQGAWYCRMETENWDDPKPLVDLKPTLDLAHWFHALAVFRETGSMRILAEQVDDKKAKQALNDYSSFFLTGMPIEASSQASLILKQLETNASVLPNIPLVEEIRNRIVEELRPLAGPTIEDDRKKGLPLDQEELERQATYIDRYLATGQLNLAFGLMREWLVSFVIHSKETDNDWLHHKKGRMPVEHNLGGMLALLQDKENPVRGSMTDKQKEWAKLWNDITSTRNALQHHGMKPESFKPDSKVIKRLRQTWDQVKTWTSPPLFGGGQGRLLICPIGMTPGVLYSALKNTTPDRVIIICSEQSKPGIDAAFAEAGSDAETTTLLLRNTHTGIDEFAGLITEASLWLFEADEIHANLTGGPTLMGVLVGQLAKRAGREYQRPVREFILIDKRSPEEQRNDPWQLGEIQYLNKEPPDDTCTEQRFDDVAAQLMETQR